MILKNATPWKHLEMNLFTNYDKVCEKFAFQYGDLINFLKLNGQNHSRIIRIIITKIANFCDNFSMPYYKRLIIMFADFQFENPNFEKQ